MIRIIHDSFGNFYAPQLPQNTQSTSDMMAYYYSNLWSSWRHNSEALFYNISIQRSCDIRNNDLWVIWQSS